MLLVFFLNIIELGSISILRAKNFWPDSFVEVNSMKEILGRFIKVAWNTSSNKKIFVNVTKLHTRQNGEVGLCRGGREECLLARKDFLCKYFTSSLFSSKVLSLFGIVGLIKFINNKVDYIINGDEVTFSLCLIVTPPPDLQDYERQQTPLSFFRVLRWRE